jgi:hypothetical protein
MGRQTMTSDTLCIDPAFQNLIDPLSPEEASALRASLVREGRALDPIKVWRGNVLDGHNRLALCRELGLPFTTCELEFPDRNAALDWIDQNQRARRNETKDQAVMRAALRGRDYPGESRMLAMAREMIAAGSKRVDYVRFQRWTMRNAYGAFLDDMGRREKKVTSKAGALDRVRDAAKRLKTKTECEQAIAILAARMGGL